MKYKIISIPIIIAISIAVLFTMYFYQTHQKPTYIGEPAVKHNQKVG